MGYEGDFGSDGHDVGDLELGERELLNGNALGDVAGEDGCGGGHGNGEAHVDIVGCDGRGGEAIAGGNGNVDVKTAVGATVGAVDRQVGGTNVSIVEVLVEGVLEADLDLLQVTESMWYGWRPWTPPHPALSVM